MSVKRKVILLVLANEARGLVMSIPGWVVWFHHVFR